MNACGTFMKMVRMMDRNNKGIIGGFYIKPNEFKTTKGRIANFKELHINEQQNKDSSFGGIEIASKDKEQEN